MRGAAAPHVAAEEARASREYVRLFFRAFLMKANLAN